MSHRNLLKPGKLIGILCVGWALSAGASTASADTDVSLTFGSAIDNQYQARAMLADHDMLGTFYINSGRIGNAGRLTWKQVTELAQDGNEIGGQTVDNFNLVGMTPADLQHQVCDDRTELLQRGYAPTSFNYPTTASQTDAAAQAMVEQCGYSSARGDTGLTNPPDSESIPPANQWRVRTRGTVDSADTLAVIQGWIQEAETEGAGGHNWFPLAFNSICDGPVPATCPTSRITTADFDALLDWLELREGSGTEVKTVREVMTGTDQPEPPPVPGTVVSLTFDDGNDNQVNAQPILEDHGMDGTFYVITGRVGTPTYMTWSEIDSLNADGNEIAGHTVNHPHLPTLTPAQQQAEICNARNTLITRYGEDNSFAYPFGDHDAVSEAKVEECGYPSGRGVSGIGGLGEPKAESIPPNDPYVVRTRGSVDINDTLLEVQDWIMDAEQIGNGWLNLVFHDVCTVGVDANCTDSRMDTADFDALLDWLEPRETSMGTEVKTMEDVMVNGPPPPNVDTQDPVTQIACDGAPCTAGFYDGTDVTLSATDAGGSGVDEIRYTLDGSLPTGSSPVYTGPIELDETTTVRYRATDNMGNAEAPKTQTVNVELTAPVSQIQCNGAACAGSYNSTVSATLSATDSGGSGLKNIRFTTDGSEPTGSSTVYSGAIPVNTTTTIKFRAEDNAGNVETPVNSQTIVVDTTAPITQIACDAAPCTSAYNHSVSATLSATDAGGSGVQNIYFTTDGSLPTTSSPVFSTPITVSSTTTIRFRAQDNAGNLETAKSQTIVIDNANPTSSIQCNAAACSPDHYGANVAVTLSAIDAGAAGVKEIRYTTDGSTPTGSSQLYTGAFNLTQDTEVRFRAEDNAGNVESQHVQLVLVDTAAPTTTILCDGAACQPAYNHAVNATLSATDSGTSGVDEIRYTLNGTTPDLSSPIYSGPIPVSSTTTIKFRAFDNAGNAEATKTQAIVIDTAAPVSAIACDGSPCVASYDHAINATLSATDSGGGGLKEIRYTTDNTPVTVSSPLYTGAIPISSTTTVRWRAFDNAGNLEAPHVQTITIDTVDPVSQIACNGSACQSGFYNSAVSATLSATDSGGSGLKNIRFTTDGSEPTGSSTVYSGAIPVSATTTIKFRAEDNAGNVETPVHSQTIKIDSSAPVTTMDCDHATCLATGYDHVVRATLASTGGGAGSAAVTEIRYTLDGTAPNDSSTLYTGDFFIDQTTTVKFRAKDEAGNTESVKSVHVVVDEGPPTTTISCDGAACLPFYDHAISATLTAQDPGGGGPKEIRYTTDGSVPTASSTLYTGPIAVASTTTIRFRAEDHVGNVEDPKSQTIGIDTVDPTSSIQCDAAACSSGHYNQAVSATLSASDAGGSGLKNIRYTTNGSDPTGSSPVYSGPIPVNATTTIKFRAEDNAGNVESPVHSQTVNVDTAAPTTTISCDAAACQPAYNHAVNATLSATDSGTAGVDSIRYTTDGSTPTLSSPAYSGPIPVSSTTTIKYRAFDEAGNAEDTKSQAIVIDAAAPVSAIECNGAACAGFYNSSVSATLSATDSGGSSLKNIRFTTNGSDPTGSSPVYSGPIPVNATTTIKFRAEDNAGNVESPVHSQTINIDTAAPTSAIECDGAACEPYYTSAVNATLSATDSGTSGVDEIRFTTDGSAPTASSPAYSGPIPVNSTTTIKYRAFDNAGNAEATQTQVIVIDTAAPVSQIACDGGPCAASYDHGINVTLSANDASGSGLKEIRYTTDGTDPTGSSPIYNGGAIPVIATTTFKFRAEDNAGNVESPVQSRTVTITSPSSTPPDPPLGVVSPDCSSIKKKLKKAKTKKAKQKLQKKLKSCLRG